jgi:hypothetical protein
MVRFIILFLMVLVLIPVSHVFGHPPQGVTLEFDSTEHLLKITVTHDVKDLTKHYVDRVVVKLNDHEIIDQTLKSQVDSETQVVVYKIIDAQPGDEIVATAGCNISGRKKATIVVGEDVPEEQEVPAEEE